MRSVSGEAVVTARTRKYLILRRRFAISKWQWRLRVSGGANQERVGSGGGKSGATGADGSGQSSDANRG